MAKKKTFELDDDYGFGPELEMPSFDFEPGEVKDDRKPATKAIKIASAVGEGIKDQMMSPAFIRRMIRESLPQGYGTAMEMADESAGALRNLYNDAAKEIKPVVKDLKRVTNRMVPQAEAILPAKLAAKVKAWAQSDSDKDERNLSAEQLRDGALQAQLGEIFKYQTEQQQNEKAQNETRDVIRDNIERTRHHDMFGQLDSIRINLQQIAGYQNKVDAAYQRKSLELQFRHYFVAQDSLAETKRFNAIAQTSLEAIQKNTGLPEFVKLKNSERLHEALRNRFIDGLNDSVFAKRREFFKKVGGSLFGSAKEKLSGFLENVKTGIGAADAMMDVREMQRDMGGIGPSGSELAGNVAGGMVADTLGTRVGKGVRKVIDRFDTEGRVDRVGNYLQYGAENAPQLLTDYARSDRHETGGWFDPFIRTVKDAILGTSAVDNSIISDKLGGMQDPVEFNRSTQKSIVEIIPGYLARIYRELQVTRTGNEKIGLTTFDFNSNKFIDKVTANSNTFKSIFNKDERNATRESVDSLIDDIDPEKKLTPEQRKALALQMLNDNLTNASGSAKRLSNYDTYTGEAGRYAGTFSSLFEDYFREDKNGRRQQTFARRFGKLGQHISDSRKTIQDHVNVGNREYLEELGILKPGSDQINMKKLYEYFYNNDFTPPEASEERQLLTRRRLGDRARLNPTVVQQTTPRPNPAPFVNPQPMFQPSQVQQPQPSPFMQTDEQLLKAIRESSSKGISEIINETLLRIEKRLNEGFGPGGDAGSAEGAPAGKTRWWRKSLGQLGADVWDAGTNLAGKANRAVSWLGNGVIDNAKRGLGMATNLANYGWDRIRGLRDVYVSGEAGPRLLAAKMRAGEYRDQVTGKVIKSFRDIKGAVVDEAGNIVLRAEEIRESFTKDGLGKKALNALGATAGKLKQWGEGALSALPVFYQTGLKAVRALYGTLYLPEDVYVRGEEDPILLARIMKAGGYRSKLTGKLIRNSGDIDGPVIDDEGNVVLSKEDLAGGLFNKAGKPLRTGLGKLFGAVKDAAAFGFNKLRQAGTWLADKAGSLFGGVGDFFGKLVGKDGLVFSGGKTMVERLTEIRDLLQERLPERKKKILGDADGDGDRDGSFQDMMAKRKNRKAAGDPAKDPNVVGAPTGPSLMGALGGGLKGLYNKLRGKKEQDGEEDNEDDGDTVILGGDNDSNESRRDRRARRRARRTPAPRGFWGKTAHYGKAAGRGLWNGAKSLGKGALALTGLSGLGGMLGIGGGLASGAAALGSAALTGLGAVASGAGAVLAGIGSVLTAPVLLGAAAIAAVGAAGYYGYKYLTRKKLDTLSKIRYAQYGFLPEDENHLQAVFGLEDELVPAVIYEKDGTARFDHGKVNLENMKDQMKKFDVDLSNDGSVSRWLKWFANRFKPVFLTHMVGLRKVNPQATLSGVDGLKPDEKKAYLNLIKFPEGPYDVSVSPFTDMKSLSAGSKEVKDLIELAETAISKDTSSKTDIGGMNAVQTTATMAGGAAAFAATADVKAGAGKPDVPRLSSSVLNEAMKQTEEGGSLNDSRGVISAMGVSLSANQFATGKLDALTVIRFKTYGLKTMELEKVRVLTQLETMVLKNVSYGKGNTAKWEGSIEKIAIAMAPAFGVASVNSNDGTNWLSWFNQRFLPTFLNYLTAIAVATNKTDPAAAYRALKAQQAVDVAMVVRSSNGKYNGSSVGVWQMPSTPWPGYELGSEVGITENNVQGLKDEAKQAVLDEPKGAAAIGADGKPTTKAAASEPAPTTFWGKTTKAASSAWEGAKNAVSGFFGGKEEISGGRDIAQMGKGVGGVLNDIPMPKGNKSWSALKDTITAAAKMAGTDPRLMATMAAIESGFDATVKNPKSTATGLYQFIDGTWRDMMKKHAAKYGIDPNTKPTDPRANALMGAEFIKENAAALKGAVNRPLTDTDLYLAHFLGAGHAKKLLAADPKALAANLLPAPARSNPEIFYTSNTTPRTVADVYALLNDKVRNKGKQFGIDAGSEDIVTKATPALTSTTSAPPVSTPTTSAPTGAGTTVAKVAPSAPNSLGIPVAEQSPSAVPAAVPTPVAKASPMTAEPKSNVSADVAAFGEGYMSTRSRDLAAQMQYKKDMQAEMLGNIQTEMQTSNKIQASQLEVLQKILGVMQQRPPVQSTASKTPEAAPAPAQAVARSVPKAPQAATAVPVKMDKPAY